MNYSLFEKPSRYINHEYNAVKKKCTPLTVALAFADTYEVGMSHIGLKILYKIINDIPYASAERVFAPWPDYRNYLEAHSLALVSLETAKPLSAFDVIGFSLQYELCYSTVLDMLYLAHIPIRSEDRLDDDTLPLVIAGGPCTVNPMPMSPFIDVFFVGEAEEAIVEILEMIYNCRYLNALSKVDTLQELSKIEGCYIPHLDKSQRTIKRRYIKDLETAVFPDKPVVPFMSVVHDRVAVEIARGCAQGCRFCQAGIVYRPLRYRSVSKIISLAEDLIKHTGYEELSFVSLSSGDYPHLIQLLNICNQRFASKKVALSLPSLRVASVSREALQCIKSVRKTGFTMAPEAATARLRAVINKDFSDEDYEQALDALFAEGWQTLKLYYMVGLPTETDEDVQAIKDMVMKALKVAKAKTSKFVNINVTVSPFVPKAHTPLQWCAQEPIALIKQKLDYLHENFKSKRFNFKGHNPYMSLLEAVFARGDVAVSALIEQAWREGCRLDAWSDFFDFNKWLVSAEKTGIDLHAYAERTFAKDESFPYSHIDPLVSTDFLYGQYEEALRGSRLRACTDKCSACGLKCKSNAFALDTPRAITTTASVKVHTGYTLRLRVAYSKQGNLRYLSHLETSTAITRAIRRSGISVDYTKGFHPAVNVSFGPPLSVGVASLKEYFDMYVLVPFDLKEAKSALTEALPEGLTLIDMQIVPFKAPSLTAFITAYRYQIELPEGFEFHFDPKKLEIRREDKVVDLNKSLIELKHTKNLIEIFVIDTENVKIRLSEFVQALTGLDAKTLQITRLAMYGYVNGGFKEPL